MIDGKDIMPKLVTAFQRFVGGITFSVDGLKLLFNSVACCMKTPL